MRCYECGGLVRDAKVDFVLPVGGDEVIVTGVPAHVCVCCGEEILDLEVVQNLEHIRDLLMLGGRYETAHTASTQDADAQAAE